MAEEVVRFSMNAVIGGDIRLVCEGAQNIQRDEFMPEIDRERRVCSGEHGYEVPLEGLYSPFCFIRWFGVRWHELIWSIMCHEVLPQAFRRFVVHDLELDEVSEL